MIGWILFTATCFFVDAGSVENIYPDNGWRPTSIEKVLELQRDFIKTPDLHFVKTLRKPPERLAIMDDFENKHFVKIPQNNEITKKILEENNVVPLSEHYEENKDEHRELIKLISPPYKEKITLEDTTSNFKTQLNYHKSNQQRRAKLIENLNLVTLANTKIDGGNYQKTKDTKDKNGIVDSTTYAVMENLEEEKPSASTQKVFFSKGSETPKTVNEKNNLTANLLDILANYNIRIGDNLRNYDISLRQNSRISNNQDFIFVPVPIKLPVRYNNANHLPVDPLIAVFLSNYGHYVPSLYGIHSGYNNLYGYLASNNIHNNKPFGSYKIFSDTDSFH